jgi:hypothetical protein
VVEKVNQMEAVFDSILQIAEVGVDEHRCL